MVCIINLFLPAGSANLALQFRKVEVTLQKTGFQFQYRRLDTN